MKNLAKILAGAAMISGVSSLSAFADDNIAACEIVVQQSVLSDDEQKESDTEATPMIATFIPAEDFVYSVFDDVEGHITEIDGHPIQALMCKRNYVIPTEFDLRLIETKIPLYLSQDFDSSASDLMAIFFKDDKYQYQYSGSDLNEDSLEILNVRMAALNSDREK